MRKGRSARRERQERAIERLEDKAQYAIDEQERKTINDQIDVIRKNMSGRQRG
jgi:hypothetical protein